MILIVDSDNESELKIKQSFEVLGYKSIIIVRTPDQERDILISKNKENNITLIIINSELKDGSGFVLCREIRKSEMAENAYVILLISSSENKTAIEKSRQSGADDYAVKPYSSTGFIKHFSVYAKSKSVFLVEDDPLIRQVVNAILSGFGVEVIELDNGIDAHNMVNSMPCVLLVLLDIDLPGMNGIQLVSRIKNKPGWEKTPVIMLTGSTDSADVKASLLAGANDYIVKPFKVDDFKKRLSHYLGRE